MTGPATPSPAPMPWVSVVLPAPRSPVAISTSPARSSPARRAPSACMASAVGASTSTGSRRRSSSSGGCSPTRTKPCLVHQAATAGNSVRVRTARVRTPSTASRSIAHCTMAPAMPRRRKSGSTATRLMVAISPSRPTIRPATGRPSTAASMPKPPSRASSMLCRVSESAAGGGSTGGRAAKAACTTASRSTAEAASTRRMRTCPPSGSAACATTPGNCAVRADGADMDPPKVGRAESRTSLSARNDAMNGGRGQVR